MGKKSRFQSKLLNKTQLRGDLSDLDLPLKHPANIQKDFKISGESHEKQFKLPLKNFWPLPTKQDYQYYAIINWNDLPEWSGLPVPSAPEMENFTLDNPKATEILKNTIPAFQARAKAEQEWITATDDPDNILLKMENFDPINEEYLCKKTSIDARCLYLQNIDYFKGRTFWFLS